MSGIHITGNLTRDPELRFTSGGKAVASFSVAETRKIGDDKEQTSFYDCQAWGTLAENIAQSLTKGMRVNVIGKLDQHTWETNTGEKRSKHVITADACGPDLRWATAAVTKDGGSSASPSGGSRAGASDPVYGDEEPF